MSTPQLFGLSERGKAPWKGIQGEADHGDVVSLDELLSTFITRETFQSNTWQGDSPEPFSLQWFLELERRRFHRYGRWIPRLLEFEKHRGELLLGVGGTLGTDWVQYARHSALVTVCSESELHLDLMRRNFELRKLSGRFCHLRGGALPAESSSVDVVCMNLIDEEVDSFESMAEETYRVLKPGGKILTLVRGRFDVDFWYGWLPWRLWLKHRSLLPRSQAPRFSARMLRQKLPGFEEFRIHKRHLRRAEVPHIWRWLPLPCLERIMGRILVVKAFKPLSAARSLSVAA
jgi:SAM-dependent methyltransferase